MTKREIKPKPEFLERMKKLLEPRDFDRYEKSIQEPLLNSIRCDTLKIPPEQLKKRLEEKNWKISQIWKNYPEVMVIEGKYVRQGSQIDIAPKSLSADFSAKNIVNAQKNFKLTFTDYDNAKNNLTINKISQRSALAKPGAEQKISSEARQILVPLEPGELGRSIEHLLGYYYVQELASMLSIIALNPRPNELILDLCASPGSKTSQISAQIKNTGTIIANDINIGRIKILASNLERCGVTNAIITRDDGIRLCEKFKLQNIKFDKILLDAPCSGEGTIRSSPKSCLMWNPNTIKSLSKLQKKLFKGAFEILKEGGKIVYSTCTHAPEENEEVVDFTLKEFQGQIEIEKIDLPVSCRPGIINWNDKNYDKEVIKSCRIYPQDSNTEGFFLAKFKKLK